MHKTLRNSSSKGLWLKLNNGQYVVIPAHSTREVDAAGLERNPAFDKFRKRGVLAEVSRAPAAKLRAPSAKKKPPAEKKPALVEAESTAAADVPPVAAAPDVAAADEPPADPKPPQTAAKPDSKKKKQK